MTDRKQEFRLACRMAKEAKTPEAEREWISVASSLSPDYWSWKMEEKYREVGWQFTTKNPGRNPDGNDCPTPNWYSSYQEDSAWAAFKRGGEIGRKPNAT